MALWEKSPYLIYITPSPLIYKLTFHHMSHATVASLRAFFLRVRVSTKESCLGAKTVAVSSSRLVAVGDAERMKGATHIRVIFLL